MNFGYIGLEVFFFDFLFCENETEKIYFFINAAHFSYSFLNNSICLHQKLLWFFEYSWDVFVVTLCVICSHLFSVRKSDVKNHQWPSVVDLEYRLFAHPQRFLRKNKIWGPILCVSISILTRKTKVSQFVNVFIFWRSYFFCSSFCPSFCSFFISISVSTRTLASFLLTGTLCRFFPKCV